MNAKSNCPCNRQQSGAAPVQRPVRTVRESACDIPLGMAKVQFQTFGEVFTPAEGLVKGTIFPGLYWPYC